MLNNHLEQLVKVGHLKEFVVGQGGGNVGRDWEARVIHFHCPWESLRLSMQPPLV